MRTFFLFIVTSLLVTSSDLIAQPTKLSSQERALVCRDLRNSIRYVVEHYRPTLDTIIDPTEHEAKLNEYEAWHTRALRTLAEFCN